jgi:hypothetical protein
LHKQAGICNSLVEFDSTACRRPFTSSMQNPCFATPFIFNCRPFSAVVAYE